MRFPLLLLLFLLNITPVLAVEPVSNLDIDQRGVLNNNYFLRWTWTNPSVNWSYNEIWIDGGFETNSTETGYRITNLDPGSIHTISIRAVGDSYSEWRNDTAKAYYEMLYDDVYIDVTDLDLTKNVKIILYNHTGQRLGEYVTGDNISLDISKSTSYIFVLKPQESSIFSDPLLAIEYLKLTIPVYLNFILFLVAFLAGAYLVVKLFR